MKILQQELSSLTIQRGLDVATRDGGFAREMLNGLAGCQEMLALDLSDKAFEKGAKKCQGLPVNFVKGDACAMDFEDHSFDLVAVANSLHHIPDLTSLFREMRRVVKPGGLLIFSEMYCDGQEGGALTHWILHNMDCYLDTFKGVYHDRTYTKAHILHMVREAGFTIKKTFCDYVEDPAVVKKLHERVAEVPERIKPYEGRLEYGLLAGAAAWLKETYDAEGISSAHQLVIFAEV